MFSRIRTERYTDGCSQAKRLRAALDGADAVVIGAGSGLSTAAGFTYAGERFQRYFSDFAAKYGFRDMYSGGFYPFPTREEFWAYWSRYILINRYQDAPESVYDDLLQLVRGKDYFVLTIKRRAVDRMRFLGKLVDGNRHQWPYRLFERMYRNFIRMQEEHQAKGEWMDSWKIEINPDHRTEGFCFHLTGCPIAKHAKEHGYGELLPYLCKTDHYLAEVMHARLIRTKTEALGGDCCDYWYVGDKSPALAPYQDLEQI